MKEKETIGYVYSYLDIDDTCDGFPRISKLYKTKGACKTQMYNDAESYSGNDGSIDYRGGTITVDFGNGKQCLYKIHEVVR